VPGLLEYLKLFNLVLFQYTTATIQAILAIHCKQLYVIYKLLIQLIIQEYSSVPSTIDGFPIKRTWLIAIVFISTAYLLLDNNLQKKFSVFMGNASPQQLW